LLYRSMCRRIEVEQAGDNIDFDDKKEEPTGEAVLASDLVASDKSESLSAIARVDFQS
jgi:hypothetical protein